MLTNPHLYEFLLAMALPFVLWLMLAILAPGNPRLLPRIFPSLKVIAWGLWGSTVVWGLYGLFALTGRKNFYWAILFALSGGTNLVHSWVRRRVNPEAYVKEPNEGWWPSKREI